MKHSGLNTILDQHRLWIESDRKQGKRANLKGANLQGANLQNANLEGANLQHAYLRGANLWDANLKGANLTGAYLEGADLRGANLWDATFTTNFKKVRWFERATFSEDQIAWVCLHPKFGEWESTLKWVKIEADAA